MNNLKIELDLETKAKIEKESKRILDQVIEDFNPCGARKEKSMYERMLDALNEQASEIHLLKERVVKQNEIIEGFNCL